jgi:hypothetical protein
MVLLPQAIAVCPRKMNTPDLAAIKPPFTVNGLGELNGRGLE